MVEILDEISEDLKKQKLNKFWEENKYWIIGGIIGSILLTGTISFWKNWEYQRDTSATAELTALVKTVSDKPADLGKFANRTNKNHATVARFILANTYSEKGEKKKALKLYKDISNTKGIDISYKELAKLLSISIRMNDGDIKSLRNELSALIYEEGTWRHTAREFKALLYAKENNFKEAINTLDKIINNPVAPRKLRKNALTLKNLYSIEENKS